MFQCTGTDGNRILAGSKFKINLDNNINLKAYNGLKNIILKNCQNIK